MEEGNQMKDDGVVLCVANSYEKKYYFNPQFSLLPETVKKELQIICVLFTEQAGGIFQMLFAPDGELLLRTEYAENDFLYDEIEAGLLVDKVQKEHQELFQELKLFYAAITHKG